MPGQIGGVRFLAVPENENGTGNPEDKTDRMEINAIKTENIRLNLKIIKNSIDKNKNNILIYNHQKKREKKTKERKDHRNDEKKY